MTTAKTTKSPTIFQLPEPLKSQDEKMTASKHLSITGGAHYPWLCISATPTPPSSVPTSTSPGFTGALTRRADTTAHGWPATGW